MKKFLSIIDMALNKIVNLGAPENDNDASTKKYVDDEVTAAKDFSMKIGKYVGDWNIDVTGESFDFVFPKIPTEYKDYVKLNILQNDLEQAIDIWVNGVKEVDNINATDNTTEWKTYHLDPANLYDTLNNTITIKHDGGSADWGHIYQVELEVDYSLIYHVPPTPGTLTLTEVDDYVSISFAKGTAVDYYEVYCSERNTDNYGLIAKVMYADVADATVNIKDYSYSANCILYYKVVAVTNGVVSASSTGNVTPINAVADVSNLTVNEAVGTLIVSYDLPSDRRLLSVDVYMDTEVNSVDLAKPASPVYSGLKTSYSYEVPDADLDKYFKFWVDTNTRT